jgi:mannosyltransferase
MVVNMKINEKLYSLIPIFLVALNLVLKGLHISSNSIGGDEPFSIYHAQMDVPIIVKLLSVGNNPPLYEIILHYWIKLFGISELSVRFPSYIFSSLTVYFIYISGIKFFNIRIALIASALFTFSSFHMFFAHEARVYALFALLVSISVYLFLDIVKGNNSIKLYTLLILTNVVLIYSHYFGFIIVVIELLTVIFDIKQRKLCYREWILYLLAFMIFCVPIFGMLYTRFIDTANTGTWVPTPSGITDLYNMLWQFSNVPVVTLCSIIVLIGAIVKLLLQKDYCRISIARKLVILWFVIPYFTMFVISFWIPMFVGRYLIFVSIAYFFLLAISLDYLMKGLKYGIPLIVIFVGLYMFTFNLNVDNKRHVEAVVDKIIELKADNDIVLISPPDFILNFSYYYDIEMFKNYDNSSTFRSIKDAMKDKDIHAIYSISGIDISNNNKVIILDAAGSQKVRDDVMKTLTDSYDLKDVYSYYEIFDIYEYTRK